MKPLMAMASWCALACALVICGCSGQGGTALPIGTPFGNEPAGDNGSELPAGSGTEGGGSPGAGGSIEQICAFDCMRVDATCPGSGSGSCASSCATLPSQYPNCVTQVRAYLVCVETAPITCDMGGGASVDCPNQINDLSNCLSTMQ